MSLHSVLDVFKRIAASENWMDAQIETSLPALDDIIPFAVFLYLYTDDLIFRKGFLDFQVPFIKIFARSNKNKLKSIY